MRTLEVCCKSIPETFGSCAFLGCIEGLTHKLSCVMTVDILSCSEHILIYMGSPIKMNEYDGYVSK